MTRNSTVWRNRVRSLTVAALSLSGWMMLGGMAKAEDPIADLPQAGTEDDYSADESDYSTDSQQSSDTARRDQPQRRAALGVRLGNSDRGGVDVLEVYPNGPAAQAGVQEGDQIISVDGQKVSAYDDVTRRLRAHQANDTVQLTLKRNGQTRKLQVTLSGGGTLGFRNRDEQIVLGSDEASEGLMDGGSQFGERAESIRENIGELAAQVGEAIRDLRGRRAQRSGYDRSDRDQQVPSDDLRVQIDRGDNADAQTAERFDADDYAEQDQSSREARPYRREYSSRAQQGRDRAQAARAPRRMRDQQRFADTDVEDESGTSDWQESGRRSDRARGQARRADRWRDDNTRNRQASAWDRSRDVGRSERAALGVTLNTDNDDLEVSGVYPGGPAEEAGLRRGDVILRVEGQRVNSLRDLVRYIATQGPGQDIEIEVNRNGRTRIFEVTLGESGDVMKAPDAPRADYDDARDEVRDWSRDENSRTRQDFRENRARDRDDLQNLRSEERDEARDVRRDMREHRRDARGQTRDTRREAREAQEEISDQEQQDDDESEYSD